MKTRVLVICLDGATFDLLDPWIESGRLPGLKRFVSEGVKGTLESVVPPITAPAWASFMTGKNPGKHGVYYFVNRGGGARSGSAAFVDARSRKGRALWHLLGEAGRKVLVLNVPTTYPPERVNGALISDFLTPPGRRDFTYPASLAEELEGRYGKYPLHIKTLPFSPSLSAGNARRLLQELKRETEVKFDAAHWLLDRYEPDFCILHILGTDRVQHELWSLFDLEHPLHNEDMRQSCAESVIDYFVRLDEEIERLSGRFGEHDTIFLISDHGFGPVRKVIDLNVWLLENGYIETATSVRSRLKAALWKRGLTKEKFTRIALRTFFRYGAGLAARIPDESIFKSMLFIARRGDRGGLLFSFDDVDWGRTRAYAPVGMGAIYINLRGREEQGLVAPGDEYRSLQQEIADKLRVLQDPETGEQISAEVYLRQEIYHGPYLDRAPDIVFLPNESGLFAGGMTGFFSNRWIFPNAAWPGHHRMKGILLARGGSCRKGVRIEGARLMDLAPTLLHLLGVEIPSDMDGRVLTELFDRSFLEARPVAYGPPDEDSDETPGLPEEEEKDVVRRLKDLGYLCGGPLPGLRKRDVTDRVVVIGLDGATFDLLGPWIETGRLPHLKRMIDEGVSGRLSSCIPPVTAPAWTSFFTGKNPGKHGVFDFVHQDRRTYAFRPVNSASYHGKALWEVMGEQGRRVAVLNVPMTHPAYPVNGLLVSDFLLATREGAKSFPPERLARIEAEFGPYPTETVPPYFAGRDSEQDVGRFLEEYLQAMRYKFRLAHCLLERENPDFLMLHLFGNDQICHWLWHILDPGHPKHPAGGTEGILGAIQEYYRAFDEEIGTLLDRTGQEVSVFIVSDHGFGPVHRSIDFNTWLFKEGYLALKEHPSTWIRRALWTLGLTPQALVEQDWFLRLATGAFVRLRKKRSSGNVDDLKQAHALLRFFLSFQDIDWPRTRAFSPFGFGQIRIHLRGQWAQGCVSEGAEYESLRDEIIRKIRALKDPETGEAADGLVLTREQIYQGDFVNEAPDIFFVPVHGKYRPKSTGFSSREVFSSSGWMTGIHRLAGVLIARGRPLNRGMRLEGLRITDLFPSILALMGLEIPDDVDGRIPEGLFRADFLRANPVRRGASTDSQRRPGAEAAQEDEEVLRRLRGLGYLE